MTIDSDCVVTYSAICIDICGASGSNLIAIDVDIVIASIATGVDVSCAT